MKDSVVKAWQDIVGLENVRVPSASGDGGMVVSPAVTSEVAAVLAVARREKVAVFPHSSGVPARLKPSGDGAILDLSRMNRIVEVDKENLIATVQPGVPLADLNGRLKEYGLMYPPDPGLTATATCGGLAAAGGGNLRAGKYGEGKHYVMGLEVVLANGRILSVGGKTVKNVAGYDLTKLFVGSRGTLAVITQLLLKLMPLPETRRCVRAFYKQEQAAAEVALSLVREKVVPSALEILNHATLQALADFGQGSAPAGCRAALLVEVDGLSVAVQKGFNSMCELLKASGAVKMEIAETAEQCAAFWHWRQSVWPALAAAQATTCREEFFVPLAAVGPAIQAVQNAAEQHGAAMSVFGHAAVGHLHLAVGSGRQGAVSPEQVRQIVAAAVEVIRALGGFVTGPCVAAPGQQDLMAAQLGPAGLDSMRALKKAFDPDNILSPGLLMGV